jgi:hypothetical protein
MRALFTRLSALATAAPTATGTYLPAPAGRTHVRPEVVVSVRFSSWTDDGRVRHPVFRGVRHDVEPGSCVAAPPSAKTHEELRPYYDTLGEALLSHLAGRSAIRDVVQLRACAPPMRMRTDGLVAFDADAKGALALRRVLEDLGLPAFAKTGEAHDFHVLAPVGEAPAKAVAAFGEIVAHLAGAGVVRVAKSPLLAPWSPIGGAGSRVSAPVAWAEVTPKLDPKRFTTRNVPARFEKQGDPMAPLLAARVDFAAAVAKVETRVAKC